MYIKSLAIYLIIAEHTAECQSAQEAELDWLNTQKTRQKNELINKLRNN